MINDLQGSGNHTENADVAVVGAGTVGLMVAVLLARKGLSVVCLESGGWRQDDDEHPFNEVLQTGAFYAGAAHGRFRGLGGTSARWGGALIPFLPADMNPGTWPLKFSEIETYVDPLEKMFGLTPMPNSVTLPAMGADSAYVSRLTKKPSFQKRNVFTLFETEARAPAGPRFWINATASAFRIENGTQVSITAHSPTGGTLAVRAKTFIFAAGAIETTRLALLLDQQNQGVLSVLGDTLGRYLHDHLSVPVARVAPRNQKVLNKIVGFRFGRHGAMFNLRFELNDQSAARERLPPHFVHIGFEEREGGYNTLRAIFRHVQQRRIPPIPLLIDLAPRAPWLVRAAWWRLAYRRLLFPDGAELIAHMVIEQTPAADNRITLSRNRLDPFGQPLANINWSVGEQDKANLKETTDHFLKMWQGSPINGLAALQARSSSLVERELAMGGGEFHPCGSTRMGTSPENGVVDKDLKLFGVGNTRLLSTASLPTAGGANPTMTLLMLGLRTVEQVADELSVGR